MANIEEYNISQKTKQKANILEIGKEILMTDKNTRPGEDQTPNEQNQEEVR